MTDRNEAIEQVLLAIVDAEPYRSEVTAAALAAAGYGYEGRTIIADMIDGGLLEGRVDRDASHVVRGVFVERISTEGRRRAELSLARRLSGDERRALARLQAEGPAAESGVGVTDVLSSLRSLGLIEDRSDSASLTLLGARICQQILATQSAGLTVISGVTNSQVTVGSSHVEGRIDVTNSAGMASGDLLDVVRTILSFVESSELPNDTVAELRADLETIRLQLESPKPKGTVVRACLQNIKAVVQGVAGNAAYAGLAELVKRLVM